ncbi:extracellular catalytic domain type 1 short-chain-length polyhydroxyalkanoate depolymerase [Paracidovorax valerianellae]|uniref:Esterase, PHB depolymerase family n=1 Tax=Paracidovorax valerianellae TaxID=187868 RepID=A0A1G6M688_9BURK|nr:PHB depolymerase family esterase [Paracidovorax valerianellae]MDA8446082.1 PHB depolymerase family esterase [Paracidovorax valerianellae]SDC50824.1 esterase, PHB depolymerase family [Paracidovorax valerianellae]
MPRSSRLFSLSLFTRAYQRNLKALARATRPARVKAAAKPLLTLVNAATPKARAPRKVPPGAGEWIGGIAPGPAGARRFHLHIPPGLALGEGEKLPLLVMLHGCGQTGADLAASSRMNRIAARERFLVLYPEQERIANAQGCWNWFSHRNGKAHAEAATLMAAVDQIARRHPVDLTRVAVAGLSAGACMAVLLAARYPERFCAVAMHSGVAPGTAESSAQAMAAMGGRREALLPVPAPPVLGTGPAPAEGPMPLPALLVLHGDADGVVSPRNACATAELWAQALGAKAGAARMQQRGKRHATRLTEFKRQGRTVVALREIQGLGHAWSGGTPSLPYSDPEGPDASALIWAFVARQFPPAP